MNEFSHFKPETKHRELDNHEWAKEVRARIDDLNELLEEAEGRNVLFSGSVAMNPAFYVGGSNHIKKIGALVLTLSERI